MILEAESFSLSEEELQLGIARGYVMHWDRTTIVKIETIDHYEQVGIYTVGRHNNSLAVRTTMARANAMQRLQNGLERRSTRAQDVRFTT